MMNLKTTIITSFTLFSGVLSLLRASEIPSVQNHKNVLFIMIDDLRPELGCTGNVTIKSPNIDKLASQGVLFRQTYCQVPVCGASRASLLTGLYPQANRFWQWDCMASVDVPEVPAINTFLKRNGYITISNGKIFHHGEDTKEGWSEPPFQAKPDHGRFDYKIPENYELVKDGGRGPAFENWGGSGEKYVDEKILDKSIADLQEFSKSGKPFFLAVGFYKPHLPFNAPKHFWDLYKEEELPLPPNPKAPVNAPLRSIHNFGELRSYSNIPDKNNHEPLEISLSRKLIHGYYACVSYVDSLVGELINELDVLGLSNNTVVVLVGDHGWNLLEHSLWCKHSNFRTSMNPAFIMSVPGAKRGLQNNSIVEFVDIYPTLCDLVGLPKPDHLEGVSLVPLLEGKQEKVKDYAYCRWWEGHSIISDTYTYTEWWENESGDHLDNMLYDLRSDRGENYNVADDPKYKDSIEKLSTLLQIQFQEDKKGCSTCPGYGEK